MPSVFCSKIPWCPHRMASATSVFTRHWYSKFAFPMSMQLSGLPASGYSMCAWWRTPSHHLYPAPSCCPLPAAPALARVSQWSAERWGAWARTLTQGCTPPSAASGKMFLLCILPGVFMWTHYILVMMAKQFLFPTEQKLHEMSGVCWNATEARQRMGSC